MYGWSEEYHPLMTRRIRKRLRIACVVIFCLLFEQLALASYLCPTEQMPAEMAAMAEHCAEMGMPKAQDNPILCAKHCNPDQGVATDSAKLSVPALAITPLAYPLVLAEPISHVAVQSEVFVAGADPPPRLRFCSLLI